MSERRKLDAITAELECVKADWKTVHSTCGQESPHVIAAAAEIDAAEKHIAGGDPAAAGAALARARAEIDEAIVAAAISAATKVPIDFQPPGERGSRKAESTTGPDAPHGQQKQRSKTGGNGPGY